LRTVLLNWATCPRVGYPPDFRRPLTSELEECTNKVSSYNIYAQKNQHCNSRGHRCQHCVDVWYWSLTYGMSSPEYGAPTRLPLVPRRAPTCQRWRFLLRAGCPAAGTWILWLARQQRSTIYRANESIRSEH
jgi:hypothetical protein